MPQRRTLAQRAKADENAMSKHLRQASQNTAGPFRFAAKENAVKSASARQALGEVTMAAVNRKVCHVVVFQVASPNKVVTSFLSRHDRTQV